MRLGFSSPRRSLCQRSQHDRLGHDREQPRELGTTPDSSGETKLVKDHRKREKRRKQALRSRYYKRDRTDHQAVSIVRDVFRDSEYYVLVFSQAKNEIGLMFYTTLYTIFILYAAKKACRRVCPSLPHHVLPC